MRSGEFNRFFLLYPIPSSRSSQVHLMLTFLKPTMLTWP